MCGRFALLATSEQIVRHFRLKRGFSMVARYNIAPTQTIPIIRGSGEQVDFARWGFIPAWAKSQDKIPAGCVNARQETILEKPMFKHAFRKQRCIVPASGYFEWKTVKEQKHPFFVTLSTGSLMGLAGVWDRWMSHDGKLIESCAIMTTSANDQIASIHDRMPVVLLEKDYATWLDPGISVTDQQMSITKLIPISLKAVPVSSRMNNPNFDEPLCVQSL